MEFIPFGPSCTPADILRTGGLRKYSLPFDWNFSFPDTIKHSLDTNFYEWFNTSNMTVYNDDPASVGRYWTKHSIYRAHTEDRIAGMFNHHNMTDPDTQEIFKKRIKRFYDIVNSDSHVIFVTMSKKKDIESNGLLNYFNRKAKTSFIYLEYTIYHTYSVKYEVINEDLYISYTAPIQFDETVGNIVSEVIKKVLI